MKDRLAKLAVGLAADCDSPEKEVEELMRSNLAGANMLPFAGFVTHDLKWIGGFSGYRDAGAFRKLLEEVDASPLLNATEGARKKLAGLADRAAKAAEREDWKTVLKSWKDGEDHPGRCPEREALDGLRAKARAWAEARLAAVVASARAGGDLLEARRELLEVRKHFAGEPEYDDADTGTKALQRLQGILKVEAGGTSASPEGLREKAAADFEGTRWEAIFLREDAGEEGEEGGGAR